MSLMILAALCFGGVAGYFLPADGAEFLEGLSTPMLYLLLFSVGIEMGQNRDAFKKVKELGISILLIPAASILGSLLGGAVLSLFLTESWKECLAIVSGLGWYSLSGLLITNSGNPTGGVVSFLANVTREILTFFVVPLIASRFGNYAAIAPGGATTMDTTLAVISRNTNGRTAVVAFLSGIIMTMAVPVLVPLFL